MKLTQITLATLLTAAPAMVSAQDWSGIYAGVQAGISDIDVNDGALTGDGPSFGGFVGYNFDNGGIVYGVEVDYDGTNYDIGDGTAEVDSTTRLKGRVGADVGGGLLYGTAGAVWATSPGLGDDNGSFFGAGYDLPISDTMTVGGEILQHQFDNYNDTNLDVEVTTFKARVAFNF